MNARTPPQYNQRKIRQLNHMLSAKDDKQDAKETWRTTRVAHAFFFFFLRASLEKSFATNHPGQQVEAHQALQSLHGRSRDFFLRVGNLFSFATSERCS